MCEHAWELRLVRDNGERIHYCTKCYLEKTVVRHEPECMGDHCADCQTEREWVGMECPRCSKLQSAYRRGIEEGMRKAIAAIAVEISE